MGVRYQLAFPGHPVPLIGQFLPKWLVTDGAINLTFFPMHNLGLNGMMRRIADPRLYDHLRSQQPINIFIGLCAFGLGLSTVPFLINFVYSMFKGPKAPKNPWNATTLEWTLPSPPGHGNFEKIPIVYHDPYEYSVPGMEQDFLPQDQPAPRHGIGRCIVIS